MNYDKLGINHEEIARLDASTMAKWNGTSWKYAICIAAGWGIIEGKDLIPDSEDRAITVIMLEKALRIVNASQHRYHDSIIWPGYQKDPENLYRAAEQVCVLYHQNQNRILELDELKAILADT